MGLVGAKLAAIPNASIALAWPIFFPFVLLAVSQFFRQLLSLKSEALTCIYAIIEVGGTYR